MINAVSTEAMILLISKDGIEDLFGRIGPPQREHFLGSRQAHYRASGEATNRACCRWLSVALPMPGAALTRSLPKNPIVMIPARLTATRLPGKPLADLAGEPMIVRVWRRAVAAELGPVVVACGDAAIAAAVAGAGGRTVLTDPGLPTGSDRIQAALAELDPDRAYDAVINVQGDMPLIAPEAIRLAFEALADPDIDIATLAARIDDPAMLAQEHVNKVAAGFADSARPARALYFSKLPVPWGDGPHYEHVGLYAYRRAALERFVRLPRGVLEQRERLEQLRALEAGMTISVRLIAADQHGGQVDTPADLERVRQVLQRNR
jgi:3-deoxy-manno-octulosonate cytidylyltransferase (CMP-KDO synthetase)